MWASAPTPFWGRGCGTPRSSCPTGDGGRAAESLAPTGAVMAVPGNGALAPVSFGERETRHAVPRAWPPPTKFRADIWGVGQVVVPYGGQSLSHGYAVTAPFTQGSLSLRGTGVRAAEVVGPYGCGDGSAKRWHAIPHGGFRSFDLWFPNIPAGRFPADAGVGPFFPCREVPAFPLPSGRDGGVAASRAAAAL